MSERTYQQKLVWDRLCENFETVSSLNEKLESRATLITTSSAAIVGIVTAAKFLPSTAPQSFGIESVLLAVVCSCAIAMFWYGSRVWIPREKAIPGSTNPTVLYEQYIVLPEDVAFNNALIDLGHAVNVGIQANDVKANAVISMIHVLQLQLLLLAVAIGWSGCAALWNSFVA
jgi:hypothetical protein